MMAARKTILLVEDEGARRAALYDQLRPDYEVLLAKDGIEGIYCYEDHAAEIAIVITGWDMPHINGAQLIKCLRFRNEALPFVLLTGHWPAEQIGGLEREFASAGVALVDSTAPVEHVKDILGRMVNAAGQVAPAHHQREQGYR